MTTATQTLADFLLARIAEDEAVARAASPGPWTVNAECDEVVAVDQIVVAEAFALSNNQLRATARFIARHDPARVLAECEAKKRIVEDYVHLSEASRGPLTRGALRAHAEFVAQVLALPYADHPDYRAEWRP